MAVTHAPDPTWLTAGAGTAAAQSARPRRVADHANGGWDDVVPATGAIAGTPGTFTPAGAQAPANLAGMTGITATPATAWTTGQHVVTADSLHTYWNGTVWAAGDAALAEAEGQTEPPAQQRTTTSGGSTGGTASRRR